MPFKIGFQDILVPRFVTFGGNLTPQWAQTRHPSETAIALATFLASGTIEVVARLVIGQKLCQLTCDQSDPI